MVKKSIGLITLFLLLSLIAACQGPQGQAGLPGNPGRQGPPGDPSKLPVIVVIPAAAKASEVITVIGTGFTPGEEVQVSLVSAELPPMLIGLRQPAASGEGMLEAIVVTEEGSFFAASSLPLNTVLPEGVYTVTAKGLSSGLEAKAPLLKGTPGAPPVQHQH